MNYDNTVETVTNIVKEVFNKNNLGDKVEIDYPLESYGLDSLQSINMMLELEQAFSIVFPDHLLTKENFETIGSIASTINEVVEY